MNGSLSSSATVLRRIKLNFPLVESCCSIMNLTTLWEASSPDMAVLSQRRCLNEDQLKQRSSGIVDGVGPSKACGRLFFNSVFFVLPRSSVILIPISDV